ncbi:trans-sialidase, putative [Trypanosoma cruzi]|uniref:Trans-sialidase, putative n=1 Tax=Trypanosoma cruzi (strain CL Brener) TaxID=353153 RepID=Q4CP29_TRYCC|nr:trans-sialidase, putative [Trypanosoma cruzi]EAN82031.1 trans-sialidase, putative [Trypanosoma cruzi]|eukprot:XP_803882.1 trans-sialidase [Trypanosoma cruzi strain CL Brener]
MGRTVVGASRMFWLTCFVPLLLALCPNEPAHALAPGSSRVELFKRQNSTVPFEENGEVRQRVVHSFRLPALVNVDGVMVAIADARYDTSNDNSLIDTVVKYSVDDGEKWETQIAIKNSRASSVSRVVDPTVIVKGNKIYVLVGGYNSSRSYWTAQRGVRVDCPVLSGEARSQQCFPHGIVAVGTGLTVFDQRQQQPRLAGAQL